MSSDEAGLLALCDDTASQFSAAVDSALCAPRNGRPSTNNNNNRQTASNKRPKKQAATPTAPAAVAAVLNTTKNKKKDTTVTRKRISKDEINQLAITRWTGDVQVLCTVAQMKAAVASILASNVTHLGFDTETRPAFRKGESHKPALVQLASHDCVYLFRICCIQHSVEPLLPILTNPHILKTGVSILQDVKELVQANNNAIPFVPAGFCELTAVTRDILKYPDESLRALTAVFLNGRIVKGKAQLSNWAKLQPLSEQQIVYAATDAWTSRQVHVQACKLAGIDVHSALE